MENFEILKNLILLEDWPESVLDFQIADETSEQDKSDRAEGIIDVLIEEPFENKSFLDFGCGEGHAAKYVAKETKSVGYDVEKSGNFNWEEQENNCLLTTNFEEVRKNGPYNIILIYDVLDHVEDPVEILNKAKSVLEDKGKIYLRTHPWCGRHGGHLYKQINKAFVHLVFSEEELKEMGCFFKEKNQKIIYPIDQYKTIINKSGLKIIKEDIEKQEVESFFKNNQIISNILKKAIPLGKKDFPEHQMSQCFHDYILIK